MWRESNHMLPELTWKKSSPGQELSAQGKYWNISGPEVTRSEMHQEIWGKWKRPERYFRKRHYLSVQILLLQLRVYLERGGNDSTNIH